MVTDDELIERHRRGDAAAFPALYERHRDRAFRWARDIVHHDEDAADVIQEAWLYLHRALPAYEPRGRFPALLFRATRHTAIDLLRRRRVRREALPRLVPAERATDPAVDEAIESLSAPLREAIRLRVRDRMSYEEIADALEIPVGTVKSRIHEAVARMRRLLVEA